MAREAYIIFNPLTREHILYDGSNRDDKRRKVFPSMKSLLESLPTQLSGFKLTRPINIYLRGYVSSEYNYMEHEVKKVFLKSQFFYSQKH